MTDYLIDLKSKRLQVKLRVIFWLIVIVLLCLKLFIIYIKFESVLFPNFIHVIVLVETINKGNNLTKSPDSHWFYTLSSNYGELVVLTFYYNINNIFVLFNPSRL